jgi:predicted phosphoribosyltransferase
MGLPMDVIVTRKIGHPSQPELGVGAIAEGLGEPVYDARLVDRLVDWLVDWLGLVLAAPVGPWSAAESLQAEADQVIIVATPSRLSSVGKWYLAFGQLTDADVLALLG